VTGLRVWVEDNQPAFRLGLITLLSAHNPDWDIGESDDPSRGLERLETQSVDLLIIAAERLIADPVCRPSAMRVANSCPGVIAITEDDCAITVLGCIALGAQATISRSMAPITILQIVDSLIFRDQQDIPDALLSILTPSRIAVVTQSAAMFSQRQLDVLRLMTEGQPDWAIAQDLGLSVPTVNVYLEAIFRSLGARNRIEAIVMARSCKDAFRDVLGDRR
jgi:DNA-binding NarL/FixJ family response regulator